MSNYADEEFHTDYVRNAPEVEHDYEPDGSWFEDFKRAAADMQGYTFQPDPWIDAEWPGEVDYGEPPF
jgi:hypothetical protein